MVKFFGGFVLFFVVLALNALLQGFVLSVIWSWFAVTIFGLPALTIVQAIGVATVVGFLTFHSLPNTEEDGTFLDQMGDAISFSLSKALSFLVIGWIVHQFM